MKSVSKAVDLVDTTQILVVGGGPVGLCAALCAARRGLAVTLLEQNFRGYSRGHAAVLHPASLRLLADLGLSQQLLAEGRSLTSIQVFVDGNYARSMDLPLPALIVSQVALEEVLIKALRREKVRIKSPCEVISLEQSQDSVRATVTRRELVTLGSPAHYSDWQAIDAWAVEAPFVIGADGHESFVRSALHIENECLGATETFAIFEGPAFSAGSALEIALNADLLNCAFPLPERRTRWAFEVDSDLDREPNLAFLRELLKRRAPWRSGQPDRVDWSTVTHFERRLVPRFGNHRVWLAGDAAHVTSPFGGQSMNVGLLEVSDLIERMASCIFQKEPLATLEQWGAGRQREWRQLLGAQTYVEAQPGTPGWLIEQAPRLVPALPASGWDLEQLLGELGLTVH